MAPSSAYREPGAAAPHDGAPPWTVVLERDPTIVGTALFAALGALIFALAALGSALTGLLPLAGCLALIVVFLGYVSWRIARRSSEPPSLRRVTLTSDDEGLRHPGLESNHTPAQSWRWDDVVAAEIVTDSRTRERLLALKVRGFEVGPRPGEAAPRRIELTVPVGAMDAPEVAARWINLVVLKRRARALLASYTAEDEAREGGRLLQLGEFALRREGVVLRTGVAPLARIERVAPLEQGLVIYWRHTATPTEFRDVPERGLALAVLDELGVLVDGVDPRVRVALDGAGSRAAAVATDEAPREGESARERVSAR